MGSLASFMRNDRKCGPCRELLPSPWAQRSENCTDTHASQEYKSKKINKQTTATTTRAMTCICCDDYNAYVGFLGPNVKFIISRIHNSLWVPSKDTMSRMHRFYGRPPPPPHTHTQRLLIGGTSVLYQKGSAVAQWQSP